MISALLPYFQHQGDQRHDDSQHSDSEKNPVEILFQKSYYSIHIILSLNNSPPFWGRGLEVGYYFTKIFFPFSMLTPFCVLFKRWPERL